MSDRRVKICGLTTRDTVLAAAEAGAAYIGLNFFPPSPRYLEVEAARDLAVEVPPGVAKVALSVDADDATLDRITEVVPVDILQLQGRETPERVAEIRARYGLPVMKAVGNAGEEDLPKLEAFEAVVDQLLVDAKPPKDAVVLFDGAANDKIDGSVKEGLLWAGAKTKQPVSIARARIKTCQWASPVGRAKADGTVMISAPAWAKAR